MIQTAGNHQIQLCILYDLCTVQLKEADHLIRKHNRQNTEADGKYNSHLNRALCIGRRILLLLRPQRMADLNLTTHLRQCRQTVGQPHKHTGCTNGRNSTCTDFSNHIMSIRL